MCSNMCSCPWRKYRCWNSVSSLSGFTRPLCSMFTTLRKPSRHKWTFADYYYFFIVLLCLLVGSLAYKWSWKKKKSLLTHVELTNKACHVVVFKVLWQNFLCKSSLVEYMKTSSSLKQEIFRSENSYQHCKSQPLPLFYRFVSSIVFL